ncbi:DUF4835 family protein [Flavobacteriaceae bacterium]|uniref:type IX secretion system protein PorD n=1 Tax=Candidatus Arcticimaribacter forsetii TaxID=2820661 RepID=UPI0020778E3D|nr:DUF4835 family protein [Candidatus Arcticimaribacter forsetii]MDA8640469.1 DUF4835 family protein [Flavobacteriaceae bacterium]MDB2325915.1 DUF4835 family protein [Flavobacteriaceae bacterium]MDB4674220.1 DUF4835 family protein [Flavobacteriaceae bacterium]MDB4716892.1 DUF4835 family protein [Flavobacteriaceae bacterium]MDB4738152.1 DUF4835 family protein [Flavobacteriaceae bacterium]
MKNLLSLFLFSFIFSAGNAQEINFQLSVNSDLVNQTNQQVFKTLEVSINEFMNNKAWTNQNRLNEERLDCSMVLNLTAYNGSQFQGTLQVQIQRPVFNTNFKTPILSHLDKDINFTYQEFQPLFYNTSTYESNLVSLLSFYAFLSLGMEADTFKLNGGNPFYATAQQILNLTSQNQSKGWNQADGNRSRYWLIETLRSNTFKEYRTVMYEYHRKGLDLMTENPGQAKQNIINSIASLNRLYSRRPNSFLNQIFFDAKSDEIVDIFSDGPEVDFQSSLNLLNKIAPFFGPKWKRIKY